jgi:hypothetical protein
MFRLFVVAALGMFMGLGSSVTANAGTITYGRSQTLEGWNERVYTTGWGDLAPDVKNFVSTDVNGDLRGFNHNSSTVWLTSPEFVVEAGPITIAQLYLEAGGGTAPTTVNDISPTKSSNGWAGIALRDQSGNFVFTYNQTTAWSSVEITAAQLLPFLGQTLRLDLISTNNSSGDFLYVNRPITVSGSSAPAVPEPASFAIFGMSSIAAMFVRRRAKRA